MQTDAFSPKPDTRPRPMATIRRVVTEPAAIMRRERVATSAPRTVVETLYSHPDAKIVSFTASDYCQSNTTGDRTPEDEDAGKLAWWSPLERTIAVGAFCVYRAPGSVAFLSCGSALQPILPKSQCWRVDQQNSKFVLQIRRPYYWRIELPVSNIEQTNKARQLKDTLESVLLFEKTICPFRRAFTVELPKKPDVKLKPWQPPRSQKSSCALSDILPPTTPLCEVPTTHLSDAIGIVTPMNARAESTQTTCFKSCDEPLTEATCCESGTGTWNTAMVSVPKSDIPLESLHENKPQHSPLDLLGESHLEGYQPEGQRDSASSLMKLGPGIRHVFQQDVATPFILAEAELKGVARSDGCSVFPEIHEGFGSQDDLQRPKLRYFLGYRGVTPPPSNSVASSHQPTHDTEATETFSSEELLESFYTAPSSLDSDPLLTDEQLPQISEAHRYHQLSSKEEALYLSNTEDQTDLAIILQDDIDIKRLTSASMRGTQVIRLPKKRLSIPTDPAIIPNPLAGAADLQNDMELFDSVRGRLGSLPRAIVSKTYDLLIGPPSHLIALMLRIAARICAGEWKGEEDVAGFATNGHVVPVRWDYSSGELEEEGQCT